MNTTFGPNALKGKHILVIGATSDIGMSIVNSSQNCGALVTAVGRNKDKLSTLSQQTNIQVLDLALESSVINFMNSLEPIDGLVYVAGSMLVAPIKIQKSDDVAQTIDSNLTQPMAILQKLVRAKKIKSGGSIVLLTSINGYSLHSKAHGAYAASKAGLNAFAKVLAQEVKEIRVNTIAAGLIATSGMRATMSHLSSEEMESINQDYILARIGSPEDVANASLFLLSDASAWITGSTLLLDGGYSLNH